MNKNEIKNILNEFENVKVGVIGDFALDIYYDLTQNTGENSLETGKPVLYGSEIKSYLGAAGNIVNNIVALGVKNVFVFGFVGNDIIGRELIYQLKEKNVNTENLLQINESWETCAYIKPIENKEEISRLDFGSLNQTDKTQLDALFEKLKREIKNLDVLIINQQFTNPLLDSNSIETLNNIIIENPHCKFFGDLRKDSTKLKNATIKLNAHVISKLLKIDYFDERDTEISIKYLKQLYAKIETPLFMVRGESGLIYVDNEKILTVPGIYLTGDIDKLGLGNTCISAFAVGLGSNSSIKDSLEIANLANAIVVKRIKQTGTASPEEILKLAEESYYNYDLALAHDPRKAKYFENTEIEIIGELPKNLEIKNVILDHDGTISTLREGWEIVMHQVMMEEICGEKLKDLATDEYNRLSNKCEKYISDTTGVQTIMQMYGLRDIVDEEWFIEKSKIKTPSEYKAIFLDRLMLNVNDRIKKFENGERTVHDFSILGAINLLNALKNKNLKLFLASGTDEDNVVIEANALGYGKLFDGGIRGSKGNEIGDAKKIVINRIITEGHCEGENLMVIGDGPVEIIEGRKVGAFCIGVASDEIRRHGINYKKRTRLIRAGANIVIPDFSQLDQLLKILFKN
ncbi:MAG: HAD hydrolase-like protein [Ignavibacteriales bacterium]|nr:HAD hydrolase-like protein [Ignavibacteriales bacterium]MCB9218248.1 HAD hydrolase-like protein [Ignavibacteriales bacterium]